MEKLKEQLFILKGRNALIKSTKENKYNEIKLSCEMNKNLALNNCLKTIQYINKLLLMSM